VRIVIGMVVGALVALLAGSAVGRLPSARAGTCQPGPSGSARRFRRIIFAQVRIADSQCGADVRSIWH
jgi:hypothetical protein